MKANYKVCDNGDFSVELVCEFSGSIHQDFLDQKYLMTDKDCDDYDVIDEFLPKMLDKFILNVIKEFEAKTGYSASLAEDPEYENYPQNEEQTKSVKMKVKIILSCSVGYLSFSGSRDLI